jgi:site-specific recombinase XerD
MPATPFPVALRKSFLAPKLTFNSLEAADAAVTSYIECIGPAYAEGTLRNLRSDWRQFRAWCQGTGEVALPAAPDTVGAYIAALASSHCPGTVRRHLASLSHLHRAFGFPNPGDSRAVRLTWRGITRRRGIRPAGQRAPLRRGEIEKLLILLGDSLIDHRDRALLLVARDTLARRSELAQLLVEDITWHAGDGGSQILIRQGKNDPEGEGRLAWLAPATRTALETYLTAAKIPAGRLFRPVIAGREIGEGLQAKAIARRFKLLAARAGLEAARISGHSTRIGMTLDLVADGQSIAAIQLAGGWRSPAMPAHYARQLLPELGAVARYYEARSG